MEELFKVTAFLSFFLLVFSFAFAMTAMGEDRGTGIPFIGKMAFVAFGGFIMTLSTTVFLSFHI